MRMPRSIVLAPGILGLFLPDGTIEGRTWRVSPNGAADFTTIQDGVHAAADGDSVLVEPGIYHEDVTFVGRQIVLMSTGGPAATIIDAANEDSAAVNLFQYEPHGTVIRGFTIRNGRGTSPVPGALREGGGIWAPRAFVTIQGNIVEECRAAWGGGLMVGDGTLRPPAVLPVILVEDNVIRHNTSERNGGGIQISNSHTTLRRNRIEGNTSRYDGGGLELLYSRGTVKVEQNTFVENLAGDKGGGLRVGCTVPNECGLVVVSWNIIARNEARGTDQPGQETGSGGGIAVHRGPSSITNNTIVRNHGSSELSCSGGGVLLSATFPTSTQFTNNIVAFNNDCGIGCRLNGMAFGAQNVVWAHELGDVGNDEYRCDGQTQGGVIRMDPLFCNLDGDDFAVSSNSPALAGKTIGANPNAGCNDVPVAPSTWGWIKAKLLRSRD